MPPERKRTSRTARTRPRVRPSARSGAGTGAEPSVVRHLNRTTILDVLTEQGPTSRADLAVATELAKPTVSAIVSELLAEGLVVERGAPAPIGRGRPPVLVDLNARSHFVVGVQVGATFCRVVVADARGVELARSEQPTPAAADAALDAIARSTREALASVDASVDQVAAVGVCIPGFVDVARGVCLRAPSLGWVDTPIAETLGAALETPVLVNDATQAAMVAEAVEGAARGIDDAVVLDVGERLAAGILIGGRLYHGATGLAGAVGHCALPGNVGRCSCGRIGCLESLVSQRAIREAVARELDAGTPSVLRDVDLDLLTGPVLWAAVEAGDAVAANALAPLIEPVILAASWLVNLLNPQRLVFLAAGAPLPAPVIKGFRDQVVERCVPEAVAGLDVVASELGIDAWVRGAVLLALQSSVPRYRLLFEGAR
jgi:predicted NBD/HSP70 family sugar kinase